MIKQPIIGIVCPCYNEEAVLPETITQLDLLLSEFIEVRKVSPDSFIALVDDGSRDSTWTLIEQFATEKRRVKGLKLAGNVGHQKALLAGLLTFNNDAHALISMDVDLQDDLTVIGQMIDQFAAGADVVYGVRKERKTDTFFKRTSALFFYRLMRFMRVNIIYNHADFRLQSNRVLEALAQYNEVHVFLRGIIPTIGFKQAFVYYDRMDRFAGHSKYPLRKMLSFAWNGITSFSTFPLKLVSIIGFLIFFACLVMSGYVVVALFAGKTVPGWVSTVLPMYFLGGIQLLCFSIIGEYIGKIYSEVKSRPRFIIDKKID
jgi:glycosyltransferase involved in cell wall biosynthesis